LADELKHLDSKVCSGFWVLALGSGAGTGEELAFALVPRLTLSSYRKYHTRDGDFAGFVLPSSSGFIYKWDAPLP